MSFELTYLLIIYGIFVLISGIFVIFNVYHILAFGLQSVKTAIVALIYLGSTIAVLAVSYILMMKYDWSEEIEFSEIISDLIV